MTRLEQTVGLQTQVSEGTQPTQITSLHPFAQWHVEPPANPSALARLRSVRWERGGLVLGASAIFALLIWLSTHHVNLFGMMGAFGGLSAYGRAWWNRRSRPQVAHLMDVPPAVPQFPVEVVFKRDGACYATDSGVVSFLERSFSYQGCRTSFSVNLEDCLPSLSGVNTGKKNSKPEARLRYSTPDGSNYELIFSAMNAVDGVGTGYRMKFWMAFSDWMRTGGEHGEQTILPPPTPHLSRVAAVSRSRIVAETVMGVSAGTLFYSLAFPGNFIGGADSVAGAVLSLVVLLIAGVCRWSLGAKGRVLNEFAGNDSHAKSLT